MNAPERNLRAGCLESCRACRYKYHSYSQELEQKQEWLSKVLSPYEKNIAPIESSDKEWHYRDKVSLRANYNNQQWEFGLIQNDEFLAIPNCPLHSDRVNQLFSLLSRLPSPEQIPLCHVQLSEQQMVLVVKDSIRAKGPSLDYFLKLKNQGFFDSFPVEGIWLNYNPEPGRWITRRRSWVHLWGQETSRHPLGDFYYHAGAFGQLNYKLYQRSLDCVTDFFFERSSAPIILDFYCGIGLSCRRWLERGARVYAVELEQHSISMAKLNAPEAIFFQGMGKHRLPQLQKCIESESNVFIYLNPPRLGLEAEVLSWLHKNPKIEKLAYLSCSARTLKRDLDVLADGFEIKNIIPFDFFPKTRHIENLVLLEKKA